MAAINRKEKKATKRKEPHTIPQSEEKHAVTKVKKKDRLLSFSIFFLSHYTRSSKEKHKFHAVGR